MSHLPATLGPSTNDNRSRPLGLVGLVAALLLVLAACAAPTPTPEPVTIRFAFPTPDQDHYQKLVDQFTQKNPNVKIELVGRRWDPLTGIDPSGADVILTSQFGLDELRRRASLISLDPLIAGDKDLNQADFLPNALKMFVDSGKTWALPAGLDPQVLYYNKELFDRRGVAYPQDGWTRDDFYQVVLKLRDEASGTFGYAVATEYLDPILFVYQHGGQLFDDLQAPERTTFTHPKTVEAVDWYAKLLREPGAVVTSQTTTTNVQGALRTGRAGMWIGPLSTRGGRLERSPWPIKWGMTTLPRDAQSATMATATGFAITTQCSNSRACWQLISFLSKQSPNSFAPARRSLAKATTGQDADMATMAQAAVDSSLMIRGADLNQLEKAIGAFMEAVYAVVNGKASAAEALAAAQQASPLP